MTKQILLILALFLASTAYADGNVDALKLALDDEYKAHATYQQVIDDFGNIRPFRNIIRSEQNHINALLPFFEKYNVEVPANPYEGKVPSFSSVKEACETGVQAEIENRDLYDRLYLMATDNDLIKVFENLQWASEERHLPAFTRCANR